MRQVAFTLAALMLSAAPGAFAQTSQGYPNYQAQPSPDQGPPPQGQGYGPPATGYGAQNDRPTNPQYDQSQDDYQAEMRQYRREKREYDRQRAAYDAQFGGGAPAGGYAPPPPPEPPAPPASWRGGDGASGGYYRYSETMPFRDGPWDAGDRGASWYRDHGCRLATPRQGPEADSGRYVPVCPDADGRYRPAA